MNLYVLVCLAWLSWVEGGMASRSFAEREAATRAYQKFWVLSVAHDPFHPLRSADPEVQARSRLALGPRSVWLKEVLAERNPHALTAFHALTAPDDDAYPGACLALLADPKARLWLSALATKYKLRALTPWTFLERDEDGALITRNGFQEEGFWFDWSSEADRFPAVTVVYYWLTPVTNPSPTFGEDEPEYVSYQEYNDRLQVRGICTDIRTVRARYKGLPK
jgi:hypothetical protein